jgi:hypothetical protein
MIAAIPLSWLLGAGAAFGLLAACVGWRIYRASRR